MEKFATEGDDFSLQQIRTSQNQVRNEKGWYTFKVNDISWLRRLFIQGFLDESCNRNATEENPNFKKAQEVILNLIEAGRGCEVVKTIEDFSGDGRCHKRSILVFGLAVCARNNDGNNEKIFVETRQAAYNILQKVCCIPTDLFSFMNYCKVISRVKSENEKNKTLWGQAHKKAIRKWYFEKDGPNLAYLVTKYKKRNRWSHNDILKLCRPNPKRYPKSHAAVFCYIMKGYEEMEGHHMPRVVDEKVSKTIGVLFAVNKASKSESEDEIIELINNHGLVWEQVPNKFLKSRKVGTEIYTLLL